MIKETLESLVGTTNEVVIYTAGDDIYTGCKINRVQDDEVEFIHPELNLPNGGEFPIVTEENYETIITEIEEAAEKVLVRTAVKLDYITGVSQVLLKPSEELLV